ncbi:hypothetical protein U9M48_041182, partial [Paspalum notatum var. saurae]
SSGPFLADEAEAVVEQQAVAAEKRRGRKKKKNKKRVLMQDSMDSGRFDLDDEDGEWAGVEPFFFDEAAAAADHEIQVRREQEEAQKKNRLDKSLKILDQIRELDPKTGEHYYARVYLDDFDLDEESPLGPTRETETSIDVHGTVCKEVKKQFLHGDPANIVGSDSADALSVKIASSSDGRREFVPCDSANVLSLKIASCDVGFPIDVYGTVIARDSIDLKCVYLFCRERDHCQLILSKDESLILSGPKRGLALMCTIYFEIDLKIKGAKRSKDKQLSKGYITLDGVPLRFQDKMVVERKSMDTKLSNVVITYAVVHYAVEATFAIEVLQGTFSGEVSACTTNIRDSLVLYDSKLSDGNGRGVIQLLRHVVAVSLKEKLIASIAAWTGDGKTKRTTIKFIPRVNGADEKAITCGSIKMRVKVTWSIISREYLG